MDTLGHQRASRACETCKERKKGCDKALPGCGYCKARNLTCKYARSAGTPVPVRWQLWSPSKTARGNKESMSDADAPASMMHDGATLAAEDMDLDEFVWAQVQRIVASLELSNDEIADRFFEGIHTWLPILSPPHFRHTVHSFGDDATPPPDFSALMLTMCLVTCRPTAQLSHASPAGLTSLYLTAKSVFAEAQTVVCASTAIVQAAVLLAAYEYASGRIDAAYISIGSASRMCHVLGIDHFSELATMQNDPSCCEDLNVWWSVIILERYAPNLLVISLKANV